MKNFIKPSAFTLLTFCMICFFIQCSMTDRPKSWKDIKSVEDVCEVYPDRMTTMLESFNLDLPGLEKVKQAYETNDVQEACSHLLNYYINGNTSSYLRVELPNESDMTSTFADSITQDIYTFQSVTGTVPRLDNEHLKWDHNGPQDDIEWAWALNRHYPVNYLLTEYFDTGNPKYIKYIDSFVKDWIIESDPYPAVKSRTAMWRGLEVSFRVKMWAKVFFNFIHTDYISPATQLLILSALSSHAHYARNFHGTTNWLTMEMSGLATAASVWPELQQSEEWLDYTLTSMTETLKEQVYADGSQTELTAHYHRVALSNFYLYYTICQKANIPLPAYFTDELENMWNYLALIMRPDGNALLNNDSDLDYNKESIAEVSKAYGRNDWLHVASNGKEGTAPANGPSFVFSYAGHMISRSGYELDDHWSFFDIGPWGSGHQHNDKLHISISAFGQDFLVDAGRFAYKGEVARKFRDYSRGSAGHNVILIDGKGQSPGPKLVEEPLSKRNYKINSEFDYAWESFDQYEEVEGKSIHTRAMMYVRDNFWVVVDKIEADRPRDIQSLWHWHPRCEVREMDKNIVAGTHKGGSLQILPVGDTDWKIDMIKGQEQPDIQGWYSKEYNQYEPNIASIYNTKIVSDKVFVWLLFPSESETRKVEAEIISQSKTRVRLKITDPMKGVWTMNVPYADSKGASMVFKL